MLKNLNNQKGFSLVELMVVVAIIGILAAIAVPSINKYMAKARQSEAKSNLSSIYSANKVFFSDYNIYDIQFSVIGYRPEGRLRYNIGWNGDASKTVAQLNAAGWTPTAILPANTVNVQNTMAYCALANAPCIQLADRAPTPDGTGCVSAVSAVGVNPATFTACAGGKATSSSAAIDTWSINQNKLLNNITDGTE